MIIWLINQLASATTPEAASGLRPSAGQSELLEQIRGPFLDTPAPPCTPAVAHEVLCGSRAGYVDTPPAAATPFRPTSNVSLPPVGLTFARGEDLLDGEDLEAWVQWKRELLRSPSELEEALADTAPITPHMDPEFKRNPKRCASFLAQLFKRRLIFFGRRRQSAIGLFS